MMNCGHTKKSNCLCKAYANNVTHSIQHLRQECKHFITHGSSVYETSWLRKTIKFKYQECTLQTIHSLEKQL